MTRPNKVYGVTIPPEVDFSNVVIPPEYFHKVTTHEYGFDSKGNYLSWDGFLSRSMAFKENREAAWLLLKFKRNLESTGLVCLDGKNPHSAVYSSSSLMAKLHKIDKLSTLDHLKLGENGSKNYLTINLVMEEAITSAQMEGATTTRLVAKEMLTQEREPRDFSEKMIINNYWLMQKALEKVEDKEPLSIEMIQEFNRIATGEVCENDHVAGEFRDGPICVRDASTNEVIHEAPDHEEIQTLLRVVCQFINTNHASENKFIHPIVKAIMLHFMVGYIHPFADGNGRTARALFYWYMLKQGYTNFQYISISALLKTSNKKYARAFVETEIDEFDLTHFIDFNLTIIIKAIGQFTGYINKKIAELTRATEDLNKSPFFEKFKFPHITLIKRGLESPGRSFTVKECENEFNVTAPAARKYLNTLAELGLFIKVADKGRQLIYIAPRDLKDRLKI